MSLFLNMASVGVGAWVCAIPTLASAGTPVEPAPIPMVLIDDQLNARPIGLLKLTAPAAKAGEIVFLEDKAGTPGTRATLGSDRVVALAPPSWIVDPLLLASPAVAPTTALPVAAPVSPTAADRSTSTRGNKAGRPSARNTLGTPGDEPVIAVPLTGFRPWLELVDGQRLPGSPARGVDEPNGAGASNGQTLQWTNPHLGTRAFSLDAISRVVLLPRSGSTSALSGEADGSGDVVILANGDRVTGFVDAVGEMVTVSPPKPVGKPGEPKAAAIPPTTVPMDQVAEIRLSNPRKPLHGIAAWLDDGSVVAAGRLEVDAGTRRATLAGASGAGAPDSDLAKGASIDVGELRAVTIEAGRLVSWSSLPVVRQEASGGRRTFEPVAVAVSGGMLGSDLNADDLVLPGPMTAEWTLPNGATRVSAWLVMEERSWAWGDCVVAVAALGADGQERLLARGRLNAADPVLALTGEFGGPASRLRVTVDPGESGPVQDRVVIRHGLVLVGSGAAGAKPTPSTR